jgi:hypothetical protein
LLERKKWGLRVFPLVYVAAGDFINRHVLTEYLV